LNQANTEFIAIGPKRGAIFSFNNGLYLFIFCHWLCCSNLL